MVTLKMVAAAVIAIMGAVTMAPGGSSSAQVRARLQTPLVELNDGPCEPGQKYVQEDLREPTRIVPHEGRIQTELVVAIRKRCVPVWVSTSNTDGHWEMQTLNLRTYGFPRDPNRPITEADADNPDSPNVAWSAPGPTLIMQPASSPGAADGTRFTMRLYNRMPYAGNQLTCVPNIKCNTKGPNAGVDPATGTCKVPPDPAFGGSPAQTPSQTVGGQVVEPPNCFHGLNSTNFHFHGFHVSPQLHQDDVGLEIRPSLAPGETPPADEHATHGEDGTVVYGQFDYDVDPLRYTQAPGTHWYHAHKHGSTALQVLNGQVGSALIRGEFDRKLDDYFQNFGGGALSERLMVVQQIQELMPGIGGADQSGAVLVNGQGNPRVHMKRGEVQRWRFVGATMQASAALRIGFPDVPGKPTPQVRQIAMDGVQFSPDNYGCQPFLNKPDCTPAADDSSFNELTTFSLAPGNRVDVLVKAPDTPGVHCLVLDITSGLASNTKAREALQARAAATQDTCGVNGLGPLFTLVIDDDAREMRLPDVGEFPAMPAFLADLPEVTDPALKRTVFYEMVGQTVLSGTRSGGGPGSGTGGGTGAGAAAKDGSQFWIDQAKYNPSCANETLTLDVPEEWTLRNNSFGVAHPFHIHQNPFQLRYESGANRGWYKYPVWRDTLAIPTAETPKGNTGNALEPNSDPDLLGAVWGKAVLTYVAKEFTGGFVHHCHILGHEDRGMMQNTQAVCANGSAATTGPVAPGTQCDSSGFCPSDCNTGTPVAAMAACPVPPAQTSDWPKAFGYPASQTSQGAKPGGGGR